MASDSVGALFFDVQIDEKTISDLTKQLEAVRKAAEDRLNPKGAPAYLKSLKDETAALKELSVVQKQLATDAKNLAAGLDAVGKGAASGNKPLTDGQKAARAYSAEIKGLFAEQKAGLKTQDETVTRLRAITTELGSSLKNLDTSSKEYGEYAKALDTAGDQLIKLETAQKRAQAAMNADDVRRYRDAVSNLRVAYESGDKGREDFIADTREIEQQMRLARGEFSRSSKEYGTLTRSIGTAQRGIATAIGNTSKLGLSQQVLIGSTNALNLSLGGTAAAGEASAFGITAAGGASFRAVPGIGALGKAATAADARLAGLGVAAKGMAASFLPLLGAAGFLGLGKVLNGFVAEADNARVSTLILQQTLAQTGQDTDTANAAFSRVADTLGLSTDQVTDAAIQLTRYGLTAEQIEKVLVAGGASALAFGKSAAAGVNAVSGAIITENSQLLNSIGIAENIGAAMGEAGKGAEGLGESAVKSAKAQAALNIILGATGQEVASLSTLLDSNAGTVNDVNRRIYDLRIGIGTFLTPSFVSAKEAAVELFDVLLEQNAFTGTNEQALTLAGTTIELVRQIGTFAIEAGGFGRQLAGVFAGLDASLKAFKENFLGAGESIRLGFQSFQELLRGNFEEARRLSEESAAADPFNLDNLKDIFTEYNDAYLSVAGGGMAAVQESTDALNTRLDTLKSNLGKTTPVITQTGDALDGVSGSGNDAGDGLNSAGNAAAEAGEAAENAVDGVELLGGAYAIVADSVDAAVKPFAQVADSVDVMVKPFAKVADSVDLTAKAFADVAEPVDITVEGFAEVADAVDVVVKGFAEVPDEIELPIPDVRPILDYAAILEQDLPDAYRKAETENELFNTGLSQAEVRADVARSALQELIDQGLDPQSDAVQEARGEWLKYEQQVDSAATANELLLAGFDALSGGLSDYSDSATGASESTVTFLSDSADAFGSLIRLDFVGFVTKSIGAAVNQFSYYGKETKQYADAVQRYGTEIADKFVEIDYQGKETFNEEAFDDYIEGIEEVNRRLGETFGFLNDINEANEKSFAKSQDTLLDAKIDYAKDSDEYKGKKGQGAVAFAQLKVELLDAYQDYEDAVADIAKRNNEINGELAQIDNALLNPELTQNQREALQRSRQFLIDEKTGLSTELGNYRQALGYEIAKILEDTGDIAKAMGISQQELYEGILSGNDEILGSLTGEQLAGIKDALFAYYQVFGVLPEGAAQAAEALGLSTTTLLAELEASDQTLGTAAANGATATREGVDALNQQLIDFFGPEKSAEIRAAILNLYSEQAVALQAGNQQLATTAITAGDAPRQVIAGLNQQLIDLFGPEKTAQIRRSILDLYNSEASALQEGSGALTTQAIASEKAVTPAVGAAIVAPGDAAQSGAQTTADKIRAAFDLIRGASSGDSGSLVGDLEAQAIALTNAQKGVFEAQKTQLEAQQGVLRSVIRQTYELLVQEQRNGVHGKPDGLIATLDRSGTDLSNALASFFNKQDTMLITQGGQTVYKIGSVTNDIRTAMNKLVAASTVGKLGSGLPSFKNSGSGGGGGSRPGAAGFFAPLNATIDERALGGMSSEFGNFDTYGLMQDIEARPFGYGTSFAQVEPDTSYRSGNVRSVGPLGGLLKSVQRGVEGYKTGVVGSINSAIKTQQKAFSALSNSFEQGVQTDTERTLKALTEADRKQRAFIKKYGERKSKAPKEEKEAYAANKKALLEFERDTFDIISGRALTGYAIIGRSDGNLTGILGQLLGSKVKLKQGLTEYQQEILDFAKTTGLALEQSVSGGISQGLKTAIKSGEALDFQQTLEGLFDTTFDGLFDQLSKQVLAQSLGPLLTDLTADITKGDVNGAAQGVQQIADKLPGIFGKLEQILAPLRGAADRLGFSTPANEPTFENLGQSIKLKARSLGSATPDWFTKMGAYFDTFGHGAELIARAADVNWRAANKIDAAADKLLKGTNSYESRNPQKLTKI